ncbi:MAG: type II toxin-antitoxin system RelE/ParE family toxin [Chitinivibrionales bacterium]|nr:type II toxin-antitoxin system RelE/ParE family toxin [Chitinivibrionales bacterium]
MSYHLRILPSARRDMRKLPRGMLVRIDRAVLALADDPRPSGVKALRGGADLYRIRVGDYRIIYTVEDRIVTVCVVRVRHRRDAYRIG